MANSKTHWAMQLAESSDHPNAWAGYAGGRYLQACGRKYTGDVRSHNATDFAYFAGQSPDLYCSDCAKAARLALAAESAPKPSSRCTSEGCGSHAINPGQSGRDDASDLDLCDVCYWRKRAESATWPKPRPISEATYPCRVLAWFPSLSGWRIEHAGYWGRHESNAYHLPTHFLPLPPEVR